MNGYFYICTGNVGDATPTLCCGWYRLRRKGDAALITLYDQQGVKSFLGTVGAFITHETVLHASPTTDARIRAHCRRFIHESALPRAPTRFSPRRRGNATLFSFIHVATHARRRFFTHVSHTAAPGVTERAHGRAVDCRSSSRSRAYARRSTLRSRHADINRTGELCTIGSEWKTSEERMRFHEWQYRAETWLGVGRTRDKCFQALLQASTIYPGISSRILVARN